MATFYAWSPILAGEKSAGFGDEVTQQGLGVSKADFEAMKDAGVIRTIKPPSAKELRTDESVVGYYQRKAREAAIEAGEAVAEAQLAAHNVAIEVS
jgi:hypothetical protein